MITKLSPELKFHIEEYIDEIEKDNVHNSIIKCPINILDDYIQVLNQIDVQPSVMLKSYIDVACCIGSKIEYGNCYHIDAHSLDCFTYEFETDTTSLLDWDDLQKELMRVCPHHHVQATISHEFFGVPRRTIKVNLQPLATISS